MKKLFIVGKPYTEEYIRKCLDTHPDIFTDSYYFDYSPYITHSKDRVLRDKTDFKQLTLQNINIPKDTFLYFEKNAYPNSKYIDEVDQIILLNTEDSYSILSFAKYLEDNHIDYKDAKVFSFNNLSDENLLKVLSSMPSDFNDVFENLKAELIKTDFKEYRFNI